MPRFLMMLTTIWLALGICACDDTRRASDAIAPAMERTITFEPELGAEPARGAHILRYYSQLDFIRVRTLDAPRTVCLQVETGSKTERVHTKVMQEDCETLDDGSKNCDRKPARDVVATVTVPIDSRECHEENTMDMPATSRVVARLRTRDGSPVDPGAIRELVLGIRPNEGFRRAIAHADERPSNYSDVYGGLHADDNIVLVLKSDRYSLARQPFLKLPSDFRPGDTLHLDVVLERSGASLSGIGARADQFPAFRSAEPRSTEPTLVAAADGS